MNRIYFLVFDSGKTLKCGENYLNNRSEILMKKNFILIWYMIPQNFPFMEILRDLIGN